MEKFLARQPILTADRVLYGYELLFRSGPENFFAGANPDFAAAASADNLLLFGIERFTSGRRAFINCTREFLVREYPSLLPSARVVIEVLETVQIDDAVLAACRRLKAAGYLIALDDFVDRPDWRPLLDLTDFVKIDLHITSLEEQQRLPRIYANSGRHFVAERVETYAEFERSLQWGYTFFQGYFFSRPQMLTRHDIPAYKLNYLRVLQAANCPQMDIQQVSDYIKAESSLSYRLLRYLNSPAFPVLVEVKSIPHALFLLGERGIRKWVSLVAIACMGGDKPAELITLPLIRARFCELMAEPAGMPTRSNDLFLLGLLSVMDAILDMKMADVLKEITLDPEMRGALLGAPNRFRVVFEVALAYERADWEAIAAHAAKLGIMETLVPELFLQAVDWAKHVLAGEPTEELAPEPASQNT